MRLISKKELLSIPHEIVFSYLKNYKSEPDDLCIYMQNLGNDFTYQPLIDSIKSDNYYEYIDILRTSYGDSSFEIELDLDFVHRDGFFEESDRYYIYSKEDLKKLIDRLLITYHQMP